MYITPPISREAYLEAARPAFQRPENKVMKRDKPRASGLAADAREIAYMMAGLEEDGYEGSREAGAKWELDGTVTQEQGRLMEDLTEEILFEAGLWVVDRQVTVRSAFPYTGHPDGRLAYRVEAEAHQQTKDWASERLSDGLVWGFEHKHLGRYVYEQIMKVGLMEASPSYILQATLYGHAFNWDACMFVIQSQDASAVRGDMTANKRAKPENRWVGVHEWQHPKVMIFGIDLRPLYDTLLPMALTRAQWFCDWMAAGGDPKDVRMEYNPYPDDKGNVGFPWSYSQYLARAQRDGQSGEQAPPLPFTGRWFE